MSIFFLAGIKLVIVEYGTHGAARRRPKDHKPASSLDIGANEKSQKYTFIITNNDY